MNRRHFLSLFALLGARCSMAGFDSVTLSEMSDYVNTVSDQPTGFFYDSQSLSHHISVNHPESPARLEYILEAVQEIGLLDRLVRIKGIREIDSYIEYLHTRWHIQQLRENEPVAEASARVAIGGALSAVDEVCQGKCRNAFCAIRPPGHHALNTGKIEGFCVYNTVAVAAVYAQQKYGFERILIVDWDYHHGNATEAMFYDTDKVLFFSTHDWHAYPGTGDPARRGEGKGTGFNINVPLSCGVGNTEISTVFKEILIPAVNDYKPQLILISAGFDSRVDDLLGCFDINDEGFVGLTRIVMGLADQFCKGKIVSVLEGGYHLKGNALATTAHLATLNSFS